MKQYTIEGHKMWLAPDEPGISKELVKKGRREFCFMDILRQECEADVGIDIGANIGYTTIPIAERCKQVFAFEPDPRSRRLLKKNVDLNVSIYTMAVYNTTGYLRMKFSKKPNQSSVSAKGQKVPCTTLDAFFEDNTPESLFIKCDIEGAEVQMIEGARDLLRRVPCCKILMELHKVKGGYDRTWGILKESGFKPKYVVNAKGMKQEMPVKPVKTFENYERAVYPAFPEALDMASRTIKGKKMLRSILWEK